MCEDARSFASSSVALMVGLSRKLFYLAAFSGLLFSIAPRMMWFLLAYAAAGTAVTAAVFGRGLMRRTYEVLRREADLRFQLVRVREAAESVAFYSGEAREAGVSHARLAAAVHAALRRVAWEAGLALWVNAYSNTTLLVGVSGNEGGGLDWGRSGVRCHRVRVHGWLKVLRSEGEERRMPRRAGRRHCSTAAPVTHQGTQDESP